jgi:NAD-dependent deacetylase
MENKINNEKINRVAELIKESKYTVVLTGAGVSTGSGIADFRTPSQSCTQGYYSVGRDGLCKMSHHSKYR